LNEPASCVVVVIVQEFIRCNPLQSQPLMAAILQTPSLTCLLAPNFSPNLSPSDVFVSMYDDLVRVPTVQGIEVAFTLLSKVRTSLSPTDSYLLFLLSVFSFYFQFFFHLCCQCFDAVSWVAGMASGL